MMNHLRTLTLVFTLSLVATCAFAQLPNGSQAPNFNVTDINGNQHSLQTYLDQGKTVVLDWSATWCGPCWNYHQSHALATLYNQYGPNGTDEFMVFMMEGDMTTELECLYGPTGCTGGTQGDWVTGTPYPIVNVDDPSLVSAYAIGYWPTIYTICPDGYIYESGQVPATVHASWLSSCEFDAAVGSVTGMDCYADKSGEIDLDVVGGAGNITYSWSNGSSTQDLTELYPGTYSCTATEGNGLERVLEDIIVEGPASELIAQLQTANNITCHGAGDGVIEVATNGGTPGYSWAWSNGATTEDLNNLEGGTYHLVVTDDNACTKELTVDIVDPDPIEAEIETTVENCGRNDGTITVDGVGGTGTLTYTYATQSNTTGIFNSVSGGTGELFVTDANNCTYSEMITIEEIPNPEAEITPPAMIDCNSTSIQLEATASQGVEFDYIWTTSNGNIVSGGTTLTPTIDAPGDYKLLVINTTNSCFVEVAVTVEGTNDLPQISVEEPELFSCATTEIVIDASNSSNGSDYVFEWTTDNGEIISGSNTDILTVGMPGTYTLVLTNTLTNCSTTQSIDVEGDSDLPIAQIDGLDAMDCENLSITLDGSSSSQGADFEYTWTTDDGEFESTNGDQAVVSAPGTYVLNVFNTVTGCESEISFTVADEIVHVDAMYAYQTNQLALYLQNMTTGNPSNMQWDMGNGDIIDGDVSFYVYDEPGVYTVCLRAENGCGADEHCEELVVSKKIFERYPGDIVKSEGGENPKSGQSFDASGNGSAKTFFGDVTVYPNPTNGDFSIHLGQEQMVEDYAIYNLDGKLVSIRKISAERSQIAVNGSELQDGTYIVRIQLSDEVIVKPLIVIK